MTAPYYMQPIAQSYSCVAGGKHGSLYHRGIFVLRMLKKEGVETHALKINKDGSPAHPLYISYDVKPIPFDIDTVIAL